MLAKINRYHDRREPRIVLKYGRQAQCGPFKVVALAGRHRGPFRAAVVVGTKVAKSAPARNRIRRRIYEALRLCEPSVRDDFSLVVVVHDPKTGTMAIGELQKALAAGLDHCQVR